VSESREWSETPASGAPRAGADVLNLGGRIEECGFADILRTLLKSRETALVTVDRERIRKTVYVLEGRIVFAGSTNPDDRLGECLLRAGMITVEQYDESARLIRPGKKQGTILVELGYITPNELVKGVKTQVETIVLGLFRWRTGAYNIEMRPLETDELITLNISTEHMVYAGVRADAGWSQVRRGLGGTPDTILAHAPDSDSRLYKLDLSEDDMHVYGLANGRLSVGQICAMSYVSNHDTCVTLYGLLCCGILLAVARKDAESLFREQVAEFEFVAIEEAVAAFNAGVAPALAQVQGAAPEKAAAFFDDVVASLLDEHYDVLREASLLPQGLVAKLVLENVSAVEPGRRQHAVELAITALRAALLSAVARDFGGQAQDQLAASFAKGDRRTR
jgi:hypothetical protein